MVKNFSPGKNFRLWYGTSLTHYSSSIVYADFAPGALGAVDYDDPSIAGSLQLLHVGIATSVRNITSTVRLKNDTLHGRLEEGTDLEKEGGRDGGGGGGERERERERETEERSLLYYSNDNAKLNNVSTCMLAYFKQLLQWVWLLTVIGVIPGKILKMPTLWFISV